MFLGTISIAHASAIVMWSLLALSGAAGVIALLSPRRFSVFARGGNHWLDTSRALAKLDAPIDIDSRVLPYSRVLGALVLAAVAVLSLGLSRW